MSGKPELVERRGRLIASTPYNEAWLAWAREHGTWDAGSRAWTFKPEQRDDVEEALVAAFGEVGEGYL